MNIWESSLTRQAWELNYNFDVFFLSVGPNFAFFHDTFGAETVEGIIGPGAWNEKSSPGAKQFYEKYLARYGEEPDYWGALVYYSSLQHFQKAVEEAGTLNQAKIRDFLATKAYDTYIGRFSYDKDGCFRGHLGEIGQWQKGLFEVIGPAEKSTAFAILKPKWPPR